MNRGGKAQMEPSTTSDKMDSMNFIGDEDVVEEEAALNTHH
jgi:hypothetical protein